MKFWEIIIQHLKLRTRILKIIHQQCLKSHKVIWVNIFVANWQKTLETLKDNNSTLEIEKQDFENNTSACPKSHKVVWVNIFVANFQKNLETLKDNKFNTWNWEILNMFHQQFLKSHKDMWVNLFGANKQRKIWKFWKMIIQHLKLRTI